LYKNSSGKAQNHRKKSEKVGKFVKILKKFCKVNPCLIDESISICDVLTEQR